jgi:GntR family transcriptional regulator
MQIDHSSLIPYYAQIQEQVRAQILAGHYVPGSMLPSEAELCDLFDVSRIVVRQALRELEFEGLIYRRRGKGSFVAEAKVHEQLVQKLSGFYHDMVEQGHRIANQILRQESLPADQDVAYQLSLKESDQVIVCERLRLVDGKPINFSISYVPHAHCPSLLDVDLTNRSLYAYLEKSCGQPIVRGRRTIETQLPAGKLADLLHIDTEQPVFKIVNTCLLRDGTPIEHSVGYHRGDRTIFQVELRRGQDGDWDSSHRLIE